jgi:hypothetical protein
MTVCEKEDKVDEGILRANGVNPYILVYNPF